MRKSIAPPQTGDIFEERREGVFGQERSQRWHVHHVYTGGDGWIYVQLLREDDGTTKTLSQNAVLDRSQFRPVE
jgi:hypothetical protein